MAWWSTGPRLERAERRAVQWWSDRVGATGLALYGRKLWEVMSSHWPTADEQPGATPAAIEYAGRWRDMPTVVFNTAISWRPQKPGRSLSRMGSIRDVRMNEGVEWAAHCCLLLDWLGPEQPVPTARLAAAFDLPPAYLSKQLQALVRAGVLTSTAGARGGFRLARPLDKITLMDVVTAIEGPEDAFACTEIRRRGAGAESPERAFAKPCAITTAMRSAELQWRRALAAQSLADVQASAERGLPGLGDRIRRWHDRG